MPFPQPIADLYAQHKNVNPDLERAEYNKYLKDWQLYLDLLELDGTKLRDLLETHGPNESDGKFETRKKLATAFNMVPMLCSMYRGYIFSDEPRIDVKGDPDLQKFLEDCDGAGTNFVQYCAETILPMALCMGFYDVLVQNPAVIGDLSTQADVDAASVSPKVFGISPTRRINWSVQSNGEYNWVTIRDQGSESFNPLIRNVTQPLLYITVSAKLPADVMDAQTGFWVRQWPAVVQKLSASQQAAYNDGAFLPPTTETDAALTGRFWAEADFTPTARVPIATLYYKKSSDPDRRHFGVSKIAVIATLTKLIIQVLSWTTEDLLANLAILALPTKGGGPAKAAAGPVKPAGRRKGSPPDDGSTTELGAFSTISFPADSKHTPTVVQGASSHIDIKLQFISALVMEVLRLCNMMWGAHAKAERVNSGVQAVVQRNELFQDLRDVANNLDRFTLEILALVKSWASNTDVKADDLKAKGVTVDYFKGPYTADSVADVIANSESVIELFRNISPAMCESALKDVARAYLYSGDPALAEVVKEIEQNAEQAMQSASEDALLAEAAAIGAQKATATATTTEQDQPGQPARNKSNKDNAAGEQKPQTP